MASWGDAACCWQELPYWHWWRAGATAAREKAGASTLFRLQTGDCFRSSAGTSGRTVEIKDVTTVPCADAHDGEVFAVVAHPAAKDAAYPGDDAVADFASGECLTRFTGYTGATLRRLRPPGGHRAARPRLLGRQGRPGRRLRPLPAGRDPDRLTPQGVGEAVVQGEGEQGAPGDLLDPSP